MWDQSQSVSNKRRVKPGILRLDISKPRRSSGGSVEFKVQPELLGDVVPSASPGSTGATSPPQLSVTWASVCDGEELDPKIDSNKTRMSQMHSQLKASLDIVKKYQSFEETINEGNSGINTPNEEGHISEEDDYSASVSAIMQRRASIRGNRKKSFRSSTRNSSPMDALTSAAADRRRSSVFTTSSGDTAASVEEGPQDSTQEQIIENIRLHKEVLQSVKYQPWSMRRKLRLVRQAKAYVAKHQGVLQERFAMSRSTKDLWARFKIMMTAKWQHWRRSLRDIATVLIPWELQIKEIESHFGSVVASYFTFLRWLLWVNIVITIMLSAFVIVPEWMGLDKQIKDERKTPLKGELKIAGNFMTIWEFNGYLKYSPLFYGYYSNFSGAVRWGYNLPLAYFLTSLVVYIYSFVATLRKMAENSRSSKLSTKDDECVFSWKLFSAWDYMIGHGETAHNRVASIVLGFKEALLEEAEKKKDKRNWKVILMRIIVNLLVLGLLGASAYTIIVVVDRSENVDDNASWWRRNEITIVINVISLVLPMVFEVLGLLESFHPREQLRLQLGRIMILNLLNLYSMIFALFFKITEKTDRLEELRQTIANATSERRSLQSALMAFELPTTSSPMSMNLIADFSDASDQISFSVKNFMNDITTIASETVTRCYTIMVNCSKPKSSTSNFLATTLLLSNLSTTFKPDEWRNETEPMSLSSTMSTSTTEDLSYYYDYGENETYYYTEEERAARRGRSISLNFSMYNGFPDDVQNMTANESFVENRTIHFEPNDTQFIPTTTFSPLNLSETSETILSETTTKSDFEDGLEQDMLTIDFYPDYQNGDEMEENCTEVVCEPWNETTTESDGLYSTTTEFSTSTEVTTQFVETPVEILTNSSTALLMATTTSIPPVVVTKEMLKDAIRNATRKLRDARKNLTGLCWETMLGQEMAKILVTDLVTVIGMSLLQDFFRALFVRYMNPCWIWDLEKKFPQYGDFKVAENVLQLVCNQGQVWLGIFFSPGLAILNLAKLIILMYVRLWIIFTCNVPHEVVFKATRSNNFYLSLLLTMLFLCVLPVGYAIVWLTPSWHCGPFSNYSRISEFFTNTTRSALPKSLHKPLEYITSSSTVIPLLLLLILIIYYLVSFTGALREANQDLRDQLQKERAEERKKMCKVNTENEKAGETANSIAARWRKVLEASSPLSPTAPAVPADVEESKIQARKELLGRIMKKALGKESGTSDDESAANQHGNNDGEDSDTEHQDPLPQDKELPKLPKIPPAETTRKIRRPSLIDIVQMVRRESINEPHPIGRFKVNRDVVDASENDPDVNSKIVAERRKSLLKRQRQLHRTDSTTLPEKDDPNVNYEIVNEKNKQVEKKTKQKPSAKGDPQVFKFDDKIIEEKSEKENHKKESPPKENSKKKKNISPTEKSKGNMPEPPPMPKFEPKSPAPARGRRKIGSFLALVKDAVNTKKLEAENQDQCDTPDIPSPFSTFEEPIEESIRVIAEEGLPQTSSSSQSGPSSKTRREATNKRQDSQGSVWSENIPVITISKSNSEECILECSDKEGESAKTRSNEKRK